MTIAALKALCSRLPWCEPAVLESVLELALEIAREGREGRRIGTLLTVGKADEVLATSRALILDPLAGHAPARTHISDLDLRGTMKELAQLDGAFVISDAGIVLAACRYLDASVEQIDLPLGFGSRHLAAASISHRLGAIAIVVSESGVVRVSWRADRSHADSGAVAARPPPHATQHRRSGSRRSAAFRSGAVLAERSRREP
jgi:DNA integrity scanning protein DisA with diadenylate cyclase activity